MKINYCKVTYLKPRLKLKSKNLLTIFINRLLVKLRIKMDKKNITNIVNTNSMILYKMKVKIHKFKQLQEKIGEIQTIKTSVLNYRH